MERTAPIIVLLRRGFHLLAPCQGPLGFSFADGVTEAGFTAAGRFYFGSGLRGNPLVLGWALCPPEGRWRRVETGEHESKAELTSDGTHPCQHEPKTDSSPLTKTVEPSLFIKCFCLVDICSLTLLRKMDVCSLQNAKHSCWYPRMNNNSSYYSLFSLSARLYALCDIVLFNRHNSPWGRYRSLPCFTDTSSQSF